MRSLRTFVTAAFVVLSFGGMSVSAQTPVYGGGGGDTASRPTAGWIFTPSFSYTGAWDDNVLLMTTVNNTIVGAYTDGLFPRAQLEFLSRRSQFSAAYEGSLVAYRDLSTLNSVDHRGLLRASRRVTRRVTLFGSGEALTSPTTELLGVLEIPYLRLGSRLVEGHGGVEIAFTKRTTLTASYVSRWADFDKDPLLGIDLVGGQSNGISVVFGHRLNRELTVTSNYDVQRATLIDNGHFRVQNGDAGVEYSPSTSLHFVGALGISTLDISETATTRRGLAWRGGVTQRIKDGSFIANYRRSFVPSYSFGGTSENEDLTLALTMPIARRFYTSAAFSARRNEPIATDGLPLRSVSIDGTLGYRLRTWMQVEGFYGLLDQNMIVRGGQLDRRRFGFQIVTAKPVRIH